MIVSRKTTGFTNTQSVLVDHGQVFLAGELLLRVRIN